MIDHYKEIIKRVKNAKKCANSVLAMIDFGDGCETVAVNITLDTMADMIVSNMMENEDLANRVLYLYAMSNKPQIFTTKDHEHDGQLH